MELRCKIYNLDIPDKNGCVFSKGAINSVYNKYFGSNIPVYIRDNTEDDNVIVGCANITAANYPEMDFYIKTNDEVLESLIKSHVGGFVMRGLGEIDNIADNKLIRNYRLKELNYTLYPAQSTSVEIINNPNISVDLAEGEDFTNQTLKTL